VTEGPAPGGDAVPRRSQAVPHPAAETAPRCPEAASHRSEAVPHPSSSGIVPPWLTDLRGVPRRMAEAPWPAHLAAAVGPARRSAVLILFGDGASGPDLLLTRRAATMRWHAGQVSFPGGAMEDGDRGPVDAALREAQEETGLDPVGVEAIGLLPELFVEPSRNLVTPVLAWWPVPSPVGVADPAEVSRVDRLPVRDLVDPAHRFRVRFPDGRSGPAFRAQGLFVWGFTGILLDRVLECAGWALPWDRDRWEPLPPGNVDERVNVVDGGPGSGAGTGLRTGAEGAS